MLTDIEAETNILATWCEELTHLKRPWCWERLKAVEGDDRGKDVWMTSLTQWIGVWANSGRWRWTGKPGVLQSMRFRSRTRLGNWTITSIKLGGRKYFGYVVVTALLQGAPNYCTSLNDCFSILFLVLLVCVLIYLFLPCHQVMICNIVLLLICPYLASCSLHGKYNTHPMDGAGWYLW